MATIFKNGKFFKGVEAEKANSGATAECMITNHDLITYIGPEDNPLVANALSDASTTTVDLAGKWVLPGFIDGHMHLLLLGSALKRVNLEPCKSLDDIRAAIKQYALSNPHVPRILCRGWMHPMTNGVALASMIDDLDPRPIFIDSKDLHSTWCNSAALAELGVETEPNPDGGEIHRDEHGRASGLISEAAAQVFVWPHIARVQPLEDKLASFKAAINAYSAAGYTGMVDMAMDENAWEALQILQSRERLPVRLAAHWLINPKSTVEENLAQVNRAIELHKQFNAETSPDLRIAGIKVICDGVVDACTAALCEPYASNGSSCEPLWREDMLRSVVKHADAAGLQCALHAIGDKAVKMAIDALEDACGPGKRHRIEHLEVTRPEDAQRLGKLGITASVQAVHADPAILRAWPKLLGHERCGRAFAYKDFLDQGAALALGTDSPTAPYFALPNIYTATTRRSAREPESVETVNDHFALSLAQGLSAASKGSAYSCFADKFTGSLQQGLKADFAIVDMDFTAENLLKAKVCETWFDGQKVFQRASPHQFIVPK
ncbi:amidohydrolase 3 [Xylona heveae TC161]|uniref:Amidohydrolase 3 n=1 Tax=Xylona heveae (strain CBS 132557 / TC161) TaxID=1328760 RepID=A0A165AID7_XYLHT|nr:amidohydrolase 3 [Xylona heveae TC161]KZF20528.1 amidohydrolase 3 [Xylona heveae TC161]